VLEVREGKRLEETFLQISVSERKVVVGSFIGLEFHPLLCAILLPEVFFLLQNGTLQDKL